MGILSPVNDDIVSVDLGIKQLKTKKFKNQQIFQKNFKHLTSSIKAAVAMWAPATVFHSPDLKSTPTKDSSVTQDTCWINTHLFFVKLSNLKTTLAPSLAKNPYGRWTHTVLQLLGKIGVSEKCSMWSESLLWDVFLKGNFWH